MKTNRRNYIVLLLLVALFVAPGVSAYLFYNHLTWLGAAKTNKGELLSPPLLLAKLGMDAKWRLILWSPAGCDQDCMQQLDKLARIRLALGRRLYQVDSLLLLGGEAPPLTTAFADSLREQDIRVLKLSAEDQHRLPTNPELFIMNPDDYLVLAYQPTTKPADIFHDLKRLLNTKE